MKMNMPVSTSRKGLRTTQPTKQSNHMHASIHTNIYNPH